MIRIRLSRGGKRNDPFYRIVAVDKHKKARGGVLEVLGHWFPRKKDLKLDKKKVQFWLAKGAQPTQTIKSLIEK